MTSFHWLQYSYKKQKNSLEARAEIAVPRIYEGTNLYQNSIALYRAWKFQQTKEKASYDCLWTDILLWLLSFSLFSLSRCKYANIKLCR